MNSAIEYLKTPELVIKIQEYFGIEYVGKDKHQQTISNVPTEEHHGRKNADYKSKLIQDACYQNGNNDHTESDCEIIEKIESRTTSSNDCGYIIRNKFWYYLFIIGTELGDEIFYATFFPFWFWNIDGAVGRRVVFIWTLIMYIGQSFKDIIRWPRPGPPVIKLQQKWGLEYGMPSTHAMVACSIPFSVFIFTMQRYQYPAYIGLVISIIWCSVICLSRLYLGMHSVLDVVVGLLLTIVLMLFVVPLVDFLDYFIITGIYSPLIVLFISIMSIVYYPTSDKWTPTRGDTAMTVSFCAGIQIGAWLNYQCGEMNPTQASPPYPIIWPTYQMCGLLLLRTILGLCCILATRAIGKIISYAVVCTLLGRDKNELIKSEGTLENKDKIIVDLCCKYVACFLIGFNTQYLLPNAFKLIEIGRPDFYTEI